MLDALTTRRHVGRSRKYASDERRALGPWDSMFLSCGGWTILETLQGFLIRTVVEREKSLVASRLLGRLGQRRDC